ncbi:MAG: response regulator [Tindallia sp. MSAO_Bac2]|nr:MAG: response regulator [Tindallia sp. MSAO_Bac2]
MKKLGIQRNKTNKKDITKDKRKIAPLTAYFQQATHLVLQRYTLEGTVLYWSEGSEALYGYKAEEVLGKNVLDLMILPEDRNRIKRELEAIKITGQPVPQREITLQRKDGTYVQVYTNFILVENPETATVELLCIDMDLTGEKRKQEELQAKETKTRQKLEAILEPDGDIEELPLESMLDIPVLKEMMYAMHQATDLPLALADLSGEILIGFGWQEICSQFHRQHPEASKACRESDIQLSLKTLPGQCQAHKCRNGLWDLALPVMVGENRVGSLFFGQFFYEDEAIDWDFFRKQARRFGFSEKEYMEALEKIPRLNREKVDHIMKFYNHLIQNITSLEYSNLLLTRNLEQQQLLEQQLLASIKKAEIASEVKDRFMTNMSHELRTPLNGLMGMLQLTEMTELTEEQRELIQHALQSCHSLTDVVEDILNHTGLVQRDIPVEEKPFNLKNVMQEVRDLHQVTAFQKNLHIHISLASRIPEELLGDRYKIKQILNNLAGNAVKFTDQGHIHLYADMYISKDDQYTLELRVKDTGTGIPESLHAHIFTAFTQADNSSTRAHDGLGLGLSTAKKLAEILGGSITLESSPGKGSTFIVHLKVKKPQAAYRYDHTLETLDLDLREPPRILVVDDELTNRKLLNNVLAKEGFQAEMANDGLEALTKAKETPYTIILMDLNMPNLDGFEATKEIHATTANPQTPIIAVTAMDLPNIRERCLEAGMKDVIIKPVDMGELKWKIREWMVEPE